MNKALNTSGQPLDTATQNVMQARLGHNFGEVRVHTDSLADSAAEEMGAAAFTVGSDLIFHREFDPRSPHGAFVLAHELAHVAQQDHAGVDAAPADLTVSSRHDPAEREADSAARLVMMGGTAWARESPQATLSCSWLDDARQWMSDAGSAVSQEGLGGLLDLRGGVDRQRAQRDLSNRFQVVDDNFVGPRLPNQVSQSEYRQIAHTYSDVRLGRGDLTIDPSALGTQEERDRYRQGALDDVASMLQTRSGRAEIEQLHNNAPQNDASGDPLHRHTTMVPLLAADGTLDRTNGYAAPDSGGSMRNLNPDGTLGTPGTGTDVHIRYNPGVNIGDSDPAAAAANPWLAQMRSDVLLSHEMNHAIQQTAGTGDPTAVQASDSPGNADVARDAAFRWRDGSPLQRIEHQAVGVGQYGGSSMTENAYRGERRLLADTHAVGTRSGDETMGQRGGYVDAPAPPAPAPVPAPAPAAPEPAPVPPVPAPDEVGVH